MKKYLIAMGFFISTLPGALCQERGDYLTGFHVTGSLVGLLLLLGFLILLWILRKIIIVGVTALILGGVGYLIGSMFLPEFAAYLSVSFFFLGLWISLKMLKKQEGNIAVVRSSMDEDDEWEWDDEE